MKRKKKNDNSSKQARLSLLRMIIDRIDDSNRLTFVQLRAYILDYISLSEKSNRHIYHKYGGLINQDLKRGL